MLMDAKTKCVLRQNEKQKRNVTDCILYREGSWKEKGMRKMCSNPVQTLLQQRLNGISHFLQAWDGTA